jgi:hypothetical protein
MKLISVRYRQYKATSIEVPVLRIVTYIFGKEIPNALWGKVSVFSLIASNVSLLT